VFILKEIVNLQIFPIYFNSYMFDEPSSYLDVKQRLKCALTIRSLLSDDRYGHCTCSICGDGQSESDMNCMQHMSGYQTSITVFMRKQV